jgi:hypothetical protein
LSMTLTLTMTLTLSMTLTLTLLQDILRVTRLTGLEDLELYRA